jgi:hypothetical protein
MMMPHHHVGKLNEELEGVLPAGFDGARLTWRGAVAFAVEDVESATVTVMLKLPVKLNEATPGIVEVPFDEGVQFSSGPFTLGQPAGRCE